jgi:shikimate dehydrogenase
MDKYGLIGKKLGHSFSKDFFIEKFKKLGIDAVYENFELDRADAIAGLLTQENLKGLNVTIPYKEAVIPYLDGVDSTAQEIGAVNCIQVKNGKAKGFNTDAFGFSQLIKPFLESHHERALILGTGGASKAVVNVLKQLGVQVYFATRTPQKENEFHYADVNDRMIGSCGILINTTPLGMFPDLNSYPEIPYSAISPQHLAIDLIYNPAQTVFLSKCKEQGAVVQNGTTMLIQQAEESWRIWNS